MKVSELSKYSSQTNNDPLTNHKYLIHSRSFSIWPTLRKNIEIQNNLHKQYIFFFESVYQRWQCLCCCVATLWIESSCRWGWAAKEEEVFFLAGVFFEAEILVHKFEPNSVRRAWKKSSSCPSGARVAEWKLSVSEWPMPAFSGCDHSNDRSGTGWQCCWFWSSGKVWSFRTTDDARKNGSGVQPPRGRAGPHNPDRENTREPGFGYHHGHSHRGWSDHLQVQPKSYLHLPAKSSKEIEFCRF